MTRFVTNIEKHPTIESDHELLRIANWKTCISREDMEEMLASPCQGAHESLLRAYQILIKVKRLLDLGTPREVLLELIALMESGVLLTQGEPKEAKHG